LRCFDGDGRVLWALRDAELRAILDGGCLVDSPERGELRRVDDKGEVADRIRGSFTEVDRFGDRVVLLTEKGKVRIIDLALKRVGGFRSGFRYLSPFICRRGGYLYASLGEGTLREIGEGTISRIDLRGRCSPRFLGS
jgi:hypothetical protein